MHKLPFKIKSILTKLISRSTDNLPHNLPNAYYSSNKSNHNNKVCFDSYWVYGLPESKKTFKAIFRNNFKKKIGKGVDCIWYIDLKKEGGADIGGANSYISCLLEHFLKYMLMY